MGWRRARSTRRSRLALTVAVPAVMLLVAGCGVLGLDETGPVDATIVTSAAPVATGDPAPTGGVTVPTLQTGTTSSRAAPTPWQSLVSTTTPSPTTTEPVQTAPSTTHTLTFTTLPSVTTGGIAAPTAMATPPPECYANGACPPTDSASSSGGTVEVLNPSGGSATVAVLTAGGQPTALSLARLGSPTVACAGSYCLVQGSKSGLYFGIVVRVSGGELSAVSGTPSSTTALKLVSSGGPVVTGTHRFDSYGLPPADSPVAARTWAVSGGSLASTGCGKPYLYKKPPAATSAQSGSCKGTPAVAGYGSASAHKMTRLGGFATVSGNIHCALVPGGKLACTAKQHSFKVKKCSKKVDIKGLRVQVGKTGAVSHDGCLNYTLVGSPKTKISYNRLAVGDGFVCEVQESGVTCTAPSGHGFSLSRAALTKK